MFYRQAGIRYTSYPAERQLWPLGIERVLMGLILALALIAPALLSPLLLSSYLLPWVIWSIAALGLNLLMGGAGQIHLGYAAVMAIGAYSATHAARAGLPFELSLLVAGLASAVIGVIFGAAALRIRGLYLAIATLAMQYIVDFAIGHIPAISGGTQATVATPTPRILGIPVEGPVGGYYIALVVCIVVTLFMLNLRRTSFGRALAAIREKDYAAEILGISAFRYKLMAFWTSSFIGGVAGAILVFCYYRSVSPEQFHLETSVQLVAMVIVGGLGSVLGTFLGAALILLAPLALSALVASLASSGLPIGSDLRAHLPLVLYGALIVGFLIAEPLGLAKLYDNARKYLLVWPFRHARS
ncbi:branched-chain amino acid ABC transporter permease [Chelatococcus reniformis]|uniref:Branched-chain amino acid ABC transporter permease n=1 Tax=Chelatococcus reniformis TaxID=1494448 RepID=A0A916TYX9_9HYPH|nr:branched-chain amino acid ABC transporter permease [Chelatococcus reniformis]GGC52775.1 branched-chain amino acid ABC transporter permease [Chelatococcus reniformis]